MFSRNLSYFAIAIIFTPITASAQNINISCWANPGNDGRVIEIQVRVPDADVPRLEDRALTRQMIEGAKNAGLGQCSQSPDKQSPMGVPYNRNIRAVVVYVTRSQGIPNLAKAVFHIASQKVTEEYNVVADGAENREREKSRAAAEAQKKSEVAAVKASARKDVLSRLGAVGFVGQNQLRTNPFPFKDRVIAVRADFTRMLSATEALFGDLIVTGLSSTQFTAVGRPSIISIKVSGLRAVKIPPGLEVNLPYGTYGAVYFCEKPRCEELVD